MATKRGLLSRIFGHGNGTADTADAASDCCSVQIEEVPADELGSDQNATVGNRGSTQRPPQMRPTDATARK